MSAFNCSNNHYQYLANALAYMLKHNRYIYAFDKLGLDYNKLSNPDKIASVLIAELQGLNALAVAGRYKEKPTFPQTTIKANSKAGMFEFNPIQVYKALSCTLYQCAEYPIVDTPKYTAWDNFKNKLASVIVSETKEYDLAEWEITTQPVNVS